MILTDDDEGEQVLERSLSENLDSLLGSKSSLTPKWADSVRMIMGSVDSVSPRTNFSTNTSSPSMVSSDDDHGQHDRHGCLDREITELEGADKFFSSICRTFNLQPTVLRMTTPLSLHKDRLYEHFKTLKQVLTKSRHTVLIKWKKWMLKTWRLMVQVTWSCCERRWECRTHTGVVPWIACWTWKVNLCNHLTFNLVNMWDSAHAIIPGVYTRSNFTFVILGNLEIASWSWKR